MHSGTMPNPPDPNGDLESAISPPGKVAVSLPPPTGFAFSPEQRLALEWAVAAAANVYHPAEATLREMLEGE